MLASIRTRFFLLMMVVLATAVVLIGFVSSRVSRIEVTNVRLEEENTAADRMCKQLVEYHEANKGWSGIDTQVDELSRLFDRQVLVTRPDGTRISAAPADLAESEITIVPPAQVHIERHVRPTVPTSDTVEEFVIERDFLNAPHAVLVASDGSALGTVFVFPNPKQSDEGQGWVDRTLVWSIVIVLALAMLASVLGTQRIVAPLADLTRAADRMTAGDRSIRVDYASEDEVGQLAQSFNALAEALERNEQIRKSMVSDIAHELRTPVTNLRGILESIEDGLRTPDARTVASLLEEISLLTRLINDLQVLALADAGELDIRPERLEPAWILRNAAGAAEAVAVQHAITIDVDVDRALPLVDADPDRLAQILRNLLGNAIAHSPHGGKIVLSAHEEDGWVRFVVRDQGPGIPDDQRSRVFERFHRLDPSRTRSEGGAGLGLAIVKQLVELHKGQVGVERAVDCGASFWFSLPTEKTRPS